MKKFFGKERSHNDKDEIPVYEPVVDAMRLDFINWRMALIKFCHLLIEYDQEHNTYYSYYMNELLGYKNIDAREDVVRLLQQAMNEAINNKDE